MFVHENIFPFHSIHESESFSNPFLELVLPSMSLDHPNPTSPNSTPPNPTPPDPTTLDPTPPDPTPPDPTPLDLCFSFTTRKSSRQVKRPSYLKDFHCNLLQSSSLPLPSTSTSYPLTNYLSHHHLSPSHRNFILAILAISTHEEPKFYHQVVQSHHWRATMQDELAAIESNHTWSVVPLPHGKHSIGSK